MKKKEREREERKKGKNSRTRWNGGCETKETNFIGIYRTCEKAIEFRERANGSGCVVKVKLIDGIG